jgi:hypothetical protein
VVAAAIYLLLRDISQRTKAGQCLHHAKTIALACRLYARDHGEHYPGRLEDLIPGYLPNQRMFACPFSPDLPMGYDYFGGSTTDPPDKVLVRSKTTDQRDRFVVVRSDMSGEMTSASSR